MMSHKNINLDEVVNIPPSLFKSMQGRYFVGQTGKLLVGEEDGKFIEGPGGDYVVVIKSSSSKVADVATVIVAFGWWENPRC